ncbi:hypothetical protein GCM10017674_05030 [Streptomyces gardneri]|uniref:Uncharacterized protein n=1 Tax=Streptomyces gardneri TaxID=66892 RepID=A0A4Y3RL85_9ACTN|nr:hypothetical protein SGA01_42060 [Streptomyces gardneri]GHG82960.1 hypothetical protein GCM10017674_05030 [Streptomyces gardneri]
MVPAGRAASGDQDPAARHAVQERADVSEVLDVVPYEQPSVMASEPGYRAFDLQVGCNPTNPGCRARAGEAIPSLTRAASSFSRRRSTSW